MTKAIATLGMVFLPGTFVSVRLSTDSKHSLALTLCIQAVFSMSFFHFVDDDSTQLQRWTVSRDMWIYWVITLPLTALTLLLWYIWQRQFMRAYT